MVPAEGLAQLIEYDNLHPKDTQASRLLRDFQYRLSYFCWNFTVTAEKQFGSWRKGE
jgi:hypothetical protein